MDKIDVINGKFIVPDRHKLLEDKKRMTVKTAWSTEVHRLGKDCWQISIQQWLRSREMGERPYIPEGYIEIDGIRYIANIVGLQTLASPARRRDTVTL